MKVILSRKGFDSTYGGYPSPILPDGRMISLPIPENSNICYRDLMLDDITTYFDLMSKLRPNIKYNGNWHELNQSTKCHLDPDIRKEVRKREPEWKACFGQCGIAQLVLNKQKVAEDDLFLFFGWFRHTIKLDDGLIFDGKGFHAIFGYMQIGDKVEINEKFKAPNWMKGHPHLDGSFVYQNNFAYLAKDKLSWNRDLDGAGVFHFDKKLALTKDGLTPSRWDLPEFFRNAKIGYHSENSWKDGYFQSVGRGQEFVIRGDGKVEEWAKEIIGIGLKTL